MPNPNFPGELANIPYQEVIGAPLNAAVQANAKASQTAAEFIKDVGFKQSDDELFTGVFNSPDEPVYVTFHYRKEVIDDSGTSQEQTFEMRVPLLLLLHVPYFEVENVTIDFNVKLNSLHKYAVSSEFEYDFDAGSETEFSLFGAFQSNNYWNVNTSYKRSTARGQEVERTYDQSVHVEAGSIEAPEGVKKLLGVLEQTITENPGEEEEEEESESET